MALSAAITQQSGFDATYWRIDNIVVDWKTRRACFRLSGYKDEQARRDAVEDAVMAERHYRIEGSEFDLVFGRLDPKDFPAFDPDASYDAGERVSYDETIYRADTAISSGGEDPDGASDWHEVSELEISRTEAYQHIKRNDLDFESATRV
jgi:hypothetical protein